jgi:hypothetical protein
MIFLLILNPFSAMCFKGIYNIALQKSQVGLPRNTQKRPDGLASGFMESCLVITSEYHLMIQKKCFQ